MQRLNTFVVSRVWTGAAASAFSYRYVNKAAQKNLEDSDSRWLEAEIDENINTPEERYAHAKEIEALKRMVAKLNARHDEVSEEVKKSKSEVQLLKSEVKKLEKQIEEVKDDD